MTTLLLIATAAGVALILLSAWDWYRYYRRPPENFRMIDQHRPATITKLATFQGKAAKGLDEQRRRELHAAVELPPREKVH